MSVEKTKDDPITREINRISNLSRARLVSEVVQMVTNWLVEHGTDLSGDDGISGYNAIEKAYLTRFMDAQLWAEAAKTEARGESIKL